MKHLFLLIAFIALHTTQAQKPEKVYGWARVQNSMEWYRQQSAAWKKVVDANPKDANAWYNYYYANRIRGFQDTTFTNKTAFMNNLINEMEKHLPDAYEYHLLKYVISGHDPKMLFHLEKAVALGEGHTEHFDEMINQGELTRDIAKRDQYAMKKYESGNISTGMMYYNYNSLIGLEPNAILMTVGDNDTYPAYVLQAMGIRKDVSVVNLSLLMMDDYRQKIFKELGIDNYEMHWGSTPDSNKICGEKYNREIVKHMAKNKKKYPVYLALTAVGCDLYDAEIGENLYLTGLAYSYSTETLDDIAALKKNFEKNYHLDYLENAFYQDISTEIVKRVNGNYIVPMTKLFDHYKASGDMEKEAWMRKELLVVSKGTPDEAEVKKHLDNK